MRQHGGMATSKSRFLRFSDFWPSECKFWWALFFVKSVSYHIFTIKFGFSTLKYPWKRSQNKNSEKMFKMYIFKPNLSQTYMLDLPKIFDKILNFQKNSQKDISRPILMLNLILALKITQETLLVVKLKNFEKLQFLMD